MQLVLLSSAETYTRSIDGKRAAELEGTVRYDRTVDISAYYRERAVHCGACVRIRLDQSRPEP